MIDYGWLAFWLLAAFVAGMAAAVALGAWYTNCSRRGNTLTFKK